MYVVAPMVHRLMMNCPMQAQATTLLPNILRSMTGSLTLFSVSMKPHMSAMAATTRTTVSELTQAKVPPQNDRIMSTTNRKQEISAIPAKSMDGFPGFLTEGMLLRHRNSETSRNGTLMKKTHLQPNRSLITPPSTGPNANPMPNREP